MEETISVCAAAISCRAAGETVAMKAFSFHQPQPVSTSQGNTGVDSKGVPPSQFFGVEHQAIKPNTQVGVLLHLG